jgi:diaminopimelate epimerase
VRLSLTKHHGLGNDFLVVHEQAPAIDWSALARQLCDRRHGIGADGLLVAGAAADGGHRMAIYNADGSRAEMSGNGIRCFAQAVAGEQTGALEILTDAGVRRVEICPTSDARTIIASVAMGSVSAIDPPARWAEIGTDAGRPLAHLSLGNPHAVVAVDDVAAVDFVTLGRIVPEVNLEIVEPGPEPDAITMRVHERGAGITEACGTGACAAAWAAARFGLVGTGTTEITVHMDGGDAKVRLGRTSDDPVVLSGPATFVATITVDVDDPPTLGSP